MAMKCYVCKTEIEEGKHYYHVQAKRRGCRKNVPGFNECVQCYRAQKTL